MIKSDQVDKSKSTCIFRLRSVLREVVRPCRSKSKMERPSGRLSVVRFSPRITGNRWRTRIEFEDNIYPGPTALQILQKTQNDLQERNIKPEKLEDRIIFMSMFIHIERTRKGNEEICISKSEKVKTHAKRFSRGHWTFFGPGDELKWYGTLSYTPERNGVPSLPRWWNDSKKPVTQYFKSIGALSRGILKREK